MRYWGKTYLVVALLAIAGQFLAGSAAWAVALKDVKVTNGARETTITLNFDGVPNYTFSSLKGPDRVMIDLRHSTSLSGLPLIFSGQNLVKQIRSSTPPEAGSTRLVVDLTQVVNTRAVTQRNGATHSVVFTLTSKGSTPVPLRTPPVAANNQPPTSNQAAASNGKASTSTGKNPFNNNPVPRKGSNPPAASAPEPTPSTLTARQVKQGERIIVAIDAGHGGQDPGAIGPKGLREKDVTMAIARKLEALLNKDPNFKPVLTRNGDYFISVMGRSDVARKQKANVLISVHADAAPNRSASGASVWVLSNRRANSEMGNWLEQHEKQSELLGGAGDLLANSSADPYLSQAVLDLQFGHSQRVGYDVAVKVLQEMQRIGSLHKRRPEHASLGVLRSPDIPSLLVETGFISNSTEERLLGTSAYQDKVARAIYQGLRSYFATNPLQAEPKQESRSLSASAGGSSQRQPATASNRTTSAANSVGKTQTHTVARGETLSGIAARYGTSMATLRDLNRLKKDGVWVGQRLKVPASGAASAASTRSVASTPRSIKHQVQRGDTLSAIASRYGVSMNEIQRVNKMKSGTVQLGQTLTIPQS